MDDTVFVYKNYPSSGNEVKGFSLRLLNTTSPKALLNYRRFNQVIYIIQDGIFRASEPLQWKEEIFQVSAIITFSIASQRLLY